MSSSTLIEVLGRILFGFTRGVTEHYNPDEPEFTAESFGYNPLEARDENGIINLLMNLFTRNTASEKPQA